jgi:hypothetical protein
MGAGVKASLAVFFEGLIIVCEVCGVNDEDIGTYGGGDPNSFAAALRSNEDQEEEPLACAGIG